MVRAERSTDEQQTGPPRADEPPRPEQASTGDIDRLRATLRLLLDDASADRLAAAFDRAHTRSRGDEADRALAGALPALRWQAARSWIRRRRGRGSLNEARPLAPAHGIAPEAGLALALQVGLGWSTARLSAILPGDSDELGRGLERARRSLAPDLPHPCDDFAAAVGRVRDPALPLPERATLLHHAQRCQACRAALDGAARVDAELERAIDAAEVALPELPPAGRALPRRLLQVGALIVAIALLIAGIVTLPPLIHGLIGARQAPVPLVREPASQPLDGWLLLAAQQGLEAVNLSTGDSRIVLNESQAQTWAFFPSPSHKLVGVWTPQVDSELEVDDVQGHAVRSWWRGENGPQLNPLGWLGESAVLGIETPPPVNGTQPADRNQLLALDVATGDSRVLYQGAVDGAVASPDGTMIALLRQEPDWPGYTLELRSVGPNGLGPPLTTIDRRLDVSAGAPTWAADSSRLYFAEIADDAAHPGGTDSGAASTSAPFNRADLVSLDRSGRISRVVAAAAGEEASPLSISPDGRQLFYQVSPAGQRDGRTSLWWLDLGGGRPASRIRGLPASFIGHAIWSPDGSTLLFKQNRTFYLPPSGPRPAGGDDLLPPTGPIEIPTMVAVGPDGVPRVVSGDISSFSDSLSTAGIIGWLPDKAVIDRQAAPTKPVPVGGLTGALAPVTSVAPDELLGHDSAMSANGLYLLVQQRMHGLPTVRDLLGGTDRELDAGTTDLSWVSGGAALVGVAPRAPGKLQSPSRLVFYAPRPSYLLDTATIRRLDRQRFDPAGIGSDTSRRYALPLMSPDGQYTSFFVVDQRSGRVGLWLAGWNHPASEVAAWSVPHGALLDPAPVALWADARTLIFAHPAAWSDGLPQQSVIEELAIGQNGSPTFTRLMTQQAHGEDRGITLSELSLSPNGERLAWRLRHYTKRSSTTGLYDTLDVAPGKDLSQTLELARGNPGDGLAWRRDGRWLAAGLAGRVALLSPDGRTVSYLTPGGATARDPIWASDTEIWFTLQDQSGARVMRVTIE